MKYLRTWRRRVVLAYRLTCAREDARRRDLQAPVGVWVCEHCAHVVLSKSAFAAHTVAAHA